MTMVYSIEDLCEYLGTTVDSLEHDIYKYTDCGAWIRWDASGVECGSIVEGSDAEFSEYFSFPFTGEEFDLWIAELERLCNEAWHEANDDEDDEEEE